MGKQHKQFSASNGCYYAKSQYCTYLTDQTRIHAEATDRQLHALKPTILILAHNTHCIQCRVAGVNFPCIKYTTHAWLKGPCIVTVVVEVFKVFIYMQNELGFCCSVYILYYLHNITLAFSMKHVHVCVYICILHMYQEESSNQHKYGTSVGEYHPHCYQIFWLVCNLDV